MDAENDPNYVRLQTQGRKVNSAVLVGDPNDAKEQEEARDLDNYLIGLSKRRAPILVGLG